MEHQVPSSLCDFFSCRCLFLKSVSTPSLKAFQPSFFFNSPPHLPHHNSSSHHRSLLSDYTLPIRNGAVSDLFVIIISSDDGIHVFSSLYYGLCSHFQMGVIKKHLELPRAPCLPTQVSWNVWNSCRFTIVFWIQITSLLPSFLSFFLELTCLFTLFRGFRVCQSSCELLHLSGAHLAFRGSGLWLTDLCEEGQ